MPLLAARMRKPRSSSRRRDHLGILVVLDDQHQRRFVGGLRHADGALHIHDRES
jgi:hypothetical protein